MVEEWLVYNPPSPLRYLIHPDGGRSYATGLNTQALVPDEDPFPGDALVEPWRVWGDPDWDVQRPDPEDEGYMIGGFTKLG